MFSSKKTVAVKAAPTTNSVPTPIQSWSDQVDLAEKKTMPQKPDTLMSMTDFLLEEPFLSEKEAPKASFHAHTPIMKKPGVLNIQGVPIIKGAEASQSATKRALCIFDNKGKCDKGKQCRLAHIPCKFGDECWKSDCLYGHSSARKIRHEQTLCEFNKSGICRYGDKCKNSHVQCDKGASCKLRECKLGHPQGRDQTLV